jgi:hypothetical protein
MLCPDCGGDVVKGATQCAECGTRITSGKARKSVNIRWSPKLIAGIVASALSLLAVYIGIDNFPHDGNGITKSDVYQFMVTLGIACVFAVLGLVLLARSRRR